jgi:hypothetical protein
MIFPAATGRQTYSAGVAIRGLDAGWVNLFGSVPVLSWCRH